MWSRMTDWLSPYNEWGSPEGRQRCERHRVSVAKQAMLKSHCLLDKESEALIEGK